VRLLKWLATIVVVLALAATGGVGWYYSGEILNVEAPSKTDYDTRVLAATGAVVTLEKNPESVLPGVWGLNAPEAYAQAGKILKETSDEVTRRLIPIEGRLQQGDLVDVDGYAYPPDPADAFAFTTEDVTLDAPLGRQPAWVSPAGEGDRWAVLVHGRAASRHECFRMVEVLHGAGVTSLCITYRNDPDGPADPDGIYRQGETEWQDVEPAVRYALDHGARDVVLVGFSMGGQITANFLRHSPLAKEVAGVIWDAPLLDWGPVIQAGAQDRGVPQWLVPIGMQASELRAHVDYADLNQIDHADDFPPPILLLHGTADETVPISVAQRFARARPSTTFVRFPGAGHVRSWNADRVRYSQAVEDFLGSLGD
jgi:alpha-beta hydrolase superfamily lysophospholipase